ncbi:MAG: pilus assembly protein TadG-related protein, partial [Comamonas sp.]
MTRLRSSPGMNRRRQSGSLLINLAISLLVCVAVLGAVQVAYAFVAKRQLQKAADMAALAGASALATNAKDTSACSTLTTSTVEPVLEKNAILGVTAEASSVVCGVWDSSYDEATYPMRLNTSVSAEDTPYNAVKVVATMEPLTLIPGLTLDKISAVALARSGDPLAQLNIRT